MKWERSLTRREKERCAARRQALTLPCASWPRLQRRRGGRSPAARRRHWHLDTCSNLHWPRPHRLHLPRRDDGNVLELPWRAPSAATLTAAMAAARYRARIAAASGTVAEQVTDYVTVQRPTTYSNGSSHASYHSETRTQYRTEHRNCYHCSFGKVSVQHCHGSGNINCGTCRQRQHHLPHLQRRRPALQPLRRFRQGGQGVDRRARGPRLQRQPAQAGARRRAASATRACTHWRRLPAASPWRK
jgi:hypothetical protein